MHQCCFPKSSTACRPCTVASMPAVLHGRTPRRIRLPFGDYVSLQAGLSSPAWNPSFSRSWMLYLGVSSEVVTVGRAKWRLTPFSSPVSLADNSAQTSSSLSAESCNSAQTAFSLVRKGTTLRRVLLSLLSPEHNSAHTPPLFFSPEHNSTQTPPSSCRSTIPLSEVPVNNDVQELTTPNSDGQ